ncbi:MAG: hypothetical protein ACKOD9_18900, partial [Rubrivivax sp.]
VQVLTENFDYDVRGRIGDAELVALLKAVDESDLYLSTRLAIEFQLLTGARPSEVAGLPVPSSRRRHG